jgi:intracellular sulfur oxidation DsrE/DsrF family protein
MMKTRSSSPLPSEPVSRRGLVARLAAAGAAGFAAFQATETVAATTDGMPRVAYHLSDREKVQFVLGNIENHIKGMGGPDKVRIALVVNGPALLSFSVKEANPDLMRRLKKTGDAGVELGACGNTLDAQKLTVADLLPGFVRVDEGGVVRLHKLQAEGWAYLRP